MRVDSGIYKGRKLLENKFDHIRPTTDKVKQSLFVKLQFFVPDKKVLDLFCGTGAIGIEALSRGAKKVVFVDKDARSVKLTQDNLKNLKIENKVHKRDAVAFIDECTEKFDLIVLDPPYKSGLYLKIIDKIFEKDLLKENGIIVCEHHVEDSFKTDKYAIFDQKRYGTIMLTYLEKNK